MGDEVGERSFSDAWRPVKYERVESVSFDRATQQLSFSEDVLLADVFCESSRSQSCCQRLVVINRGRGGVRAGGNGWFEEIGH